MTGQYLTSGKVYLVDGTTWHDITADVVNDPIDLSWGIPGTGPTDRIASVGIMSFTLNNRTHKYTPGHASAWALWKHGAVIVLQLVYNGSTYNRFRGTLDEIEIVVDPIFTGRVRARVVDWMDYTETHPLTALSIQYNKTADVAVAAIVADMPIAPQSTNYDTGEATFPAIFDTVTAKSVGYSELSKIIMSEMGYLYLKHDAAYGETLTMESFFHRNSIEHVPTVNHLLAEDGEYILTEDGINLMADDIFTMTNSMSEAEVRYGDGVINRVEVTAYPKAIDAAGSEKVLYNLSSPLSVGAGQIITFEGSYTDPTGAGRQCTADPSTMVAPAATTHYLGNTLASGAGTNLTADFTVVADYGITGASYTVTNGSTSAGFLTFLQAKGLGIYAYNPINSIVESAASYNEYGYKTETIRQTYQRDLTYGSLVASMILDGNKQPTTKLISVTFYPNRSVELMTAFLQQDIGDMVNIVMDEAGVSGYYIIQAVNVSIGIGGIIVCKWLLTVSLNLLCGLSFIGAEFDIAATGMLGYGYLPQITGKNLRSASAWIKPADTTATPQVIAGAYGSNGGWYFYINGMSLRSYQSGLTAPGAWSASIALTEGVWNHVVMTRDCTLASNQPLFYVNGVLATTTEIATQVGVLMSEVGSQFAIGNSYVAPDAPFDGIIQGVRYYGRILTQAEITAMQTDSIGALTGVLFLGPVVRTSDAAHYKDLTLTDEDKVLDAVYGVVGTRTNSVITREAASVGAPP
jgi:hypothetical protein